jgi:riboflavin kinase/FMN adenylyltransferase
MKLFRSLASLTKASDGVPRIAAIGAFDGLHLGHQAIIGHALNLARQRNERAMVVSFEPTPAEFFARGRPPARLTCFRERAELLCDFGVEELFCPRFVTVKDLSAEDFVRRLLVERLAVTGIVVGHDFRFGAGRSGSLEWLRRHSSRLGIDVESVDAVERAGERISSTSIRAALVEGRLDHARRMLGRDYSISGRVTHGLGLGKDLGFPTANVNLKRRLAPVDGIFAVRVRGITGEPLDGVASVGSRPTVGGGEALLEVFIFDFDRDIYGTYITVDFVERLREERKFPNLQSMQRQMHVDVSDAQAALRRRIA